ncbi:MAG TPA: SbcC/MukB-like Walker B domain-containing protein, partial [Kofleriaceae bacterium]|nr:SbcC/MukB-like Walker B domain-containing protein [Kofleriaceae bacterium]
EAASTVPGDLPRSRRLVDTMRREPPSAWQPASAEARDEVAGVRAAARERADDARNRLERARMAEERGAAELAELRRVPEEQPRVRGFAEALAALEAERIAAQPVYALCEPRVGADDARLAWLEALAGDEALAALVVAPEDVSRATAVVAAHAPGVRVIVRTADGLALPVWAGPLFGELGGAAQGTALAALAAAVDQATALGPVAPADARGVLEHRGAAFAPPETEPRLFGAAARRRIHAARIAAAEGRLGAARREVEQGQDAVRAAGQRVSLLEALLGAVREAHSPAVGTAGSRARAAGDTAVLRRQFAADATARADAARERQRGIEAQVEALRARAEAMNLEELQARVAELEAIAQRARDRWRELQSQLGVCENDLRREAGRREVLDAQRGAFEQELDRLAMQLCTFVPGLEPALVERYVRVTKSGDRFESLAAVEAKLHESRRLAQAAADELGRDGSRGVLHIHYAARFGFGYDAPGNRLTDRRDQPATGVLADLDRTIAEQRGVITAETRELMETLVMSSLARDLQAQTERLEAMIKGTNRLLAGIRFGRSEYQFRAVPRSDRRDLVDVVRRISVLDADSRAEFRAWIEDRIEELRSLEDDVVPELLDYRNWYDFSLRLRSEGSDGIDLTHNVRVLGSGGEQGVPNYLLILALGALMFESGGSKLRPLMFDEAFYGIDAGRRDQLMRFATELGLQILVASPDQDGVTPSVRAATTLFIVKDAHGDVHLAPYHYWHREAGPQSDLFAAPEPGEPAAELAECRT